MLAAMSSTRPMNVSLVTPDECGVISRFGRSANGRSLGALDAVARRVAIPDVDRRRPDDAVAKRVVQRPLLHQRSAADIDQHPVGRRAPAVAARPIMPSVCSVQRRRHHRHVALASSAGPARPVSAAHASPQLRRPPRAGHRRTGATEGAEQVPRCAADVAEADEPDCARRSAPGLGNRRVVHRRRPDAVAQLPGPGAGSRGAASPPRRRVLGDRPLVMKRVGHQHVRGKCVEVDLVGARAAATCISRSFSAASAISAVNRPPTYTSASRSSSSSACRRRCQRTAESGGSAASNRSRCGTRLAIDDHDLHGQSRCSAGRLLSKVQSGIRYCMATASSRLPSPSRWYSSCAAATASSSSSTPRPGLSGTVR